MSKVDKIFETYTSETTVNSYKSTMKRFLQLLYGDGDLESLVERYSNDKRDYVEDLNQFFIAIKDYSPTSIRQYLNTIKNFIEKISGTNFPNAEYKALLRRRKGSRPITDQRPPTRDELRQILFHIPDKGKALFLTLVSSGLRIGEALQLKISDVQFEKEPVIIRVDRSYAKSGNRRISFISSEAKESIIQWLRVRDKYLVSKKDRNKGLPGYSEAVMQKDRLFPFSSSTARHMWNLGLEKAGLGEQDEATRYRKRRVHSLRAFFRSQLVSAGVVLDVVEALMGHEGYLTRAYRNYTQEQIAEFYLKGEYAVTIYGGADLRELSETKEEIIQLKDLTDRDHNAVIRLLEKNDKLEEQIAKLTEDMYKMGEEFGAMWALRERIEELESYLTPDGPVLKGEVEALRKSAEELR